MKQVEQIFSKIDLDEYLESLTYKEQGGLITPEVEMLQNALDLSNIKIRECMVPRTDVAAININSSIEELKQLFIETKYGSRCLHTRPFLHANSAACAILFPSADINIALSSNIIS